MKSQRSEIYGALNKSATENMQLVAECIEQRERPPVLILSTLLIPGYIDEHELESTEKCRNSKDCVC